METQVLRTFMSFLIRRDGYGYAAQCAARALVRRGWSIEEMMPGADAMSWTVAGDAVALTLPDWWQGIEAAGALVGFTMHEATRLAPEWPAMINGSGARAVLVPCAWNRQVFEESGVRLPVYVAPFGVDQEHYWYLPRKREWSGGDPLYGAQLWGGQPCAGTGNAPYTFLWSGNGGADMRKGWDVAYLAFRRAFGNRQDVRLVLHFRQPLGGNPRWSDGNVETLVGYLDLPAWRGLLEAADCFVFPSRGEGWGLPAREAAATGLPVLTTNWGGTAVEIERYALPIEVAGMSRARYGYYQSGEIGEWAEPSVEHTAELMRWCEAHRVEAADFGAEAAGFIRGTTWERTAQAIINCMEEVAE